MTNMSKAHRFNAAALGLDMQAIDVSLRAGRGLPPHTYHDPAIYEFELAAIFENTWQFFAPVASVAHVGNVITGQVGNTPVVVAHAEDGKLYGYVNVCRHRGYRVVKTDEKECKRLYCGYHAWTYRLDGRFFRAPGVENEPGFDPAENGLIPISVDVWGPAVFVNTDPKAPKLSEAMPELLEFGAERNFIEDPNQYELHTRYEKGQAANWKLWTDNALECYHCGPVHSKSFNQVFGAEISDGRQRVHWKGAVMYGEIKTKKTPGLDLSAAWYRNLQVFPGGFILQQEDIMILGRMHPTSPQSCHFTGHFFGEKGADPARVSAWVDLYSQTFDEDALVVEGQQQSMLSKYAQPFRYIENRETTCINTARLIFQAYQRQLKNEGLVVAAE